MADKALIIIAFPVTMPHEELQALMSQVKPIFADREEVSVYGVSRDTAEEILNRMSEAE